MLPGGCCWRRVVGQAKEARMGTLYTMYVGAEVALCVGAYVTLMCAVWRAAAVRGVAPWRSQ